MYLNYENHLKIDGRIHIISGSRDISMQHDATTTTKTTVTVKIEI